MGKVVPGLSSLSHIIIPPGLEILEMTSIRTSYALTKIELVTWSSYGARMEIGVSGSSYCKMSGRSVGLYKRGNVKTRSWVLQYQSAPAASCADVPPRSHAGSRPSTEPFISGPGAFWVLAHLTHEPFCTSVLDSYELNTSSI